MSAPAFTPGPWSVDNRNAAASPPAHVIVSEHAIIGEVFAERDENEPEAVATANLIVAAPELYAVADMIDRSGHALSQPIRWALRDSLAKARGEA